MDVNTPPGVIIKTWQSRFYTKYDIPERDTDIPHLSACLIIYIYIIFGRKMHLIPLWFTLPKPSVAQCFIRKHSKSEWFDSCDWPSNLTQIGLKSSIFQPVWLKFDKRPRKIIGYLFYIKSSFVHHLKSLGEFKLESLSGNAQFGSKSAIFCPVWPWNLMEDLKKQQGASSMLHKALCIISKPWVISNWSYSPETLNSGQNRRFYVPCDLEIWWMTLENNRAPLLCCVKFCASFHSNRWIQPKVRKRSIRVKIANLLSRVTLEFDGWPCKNNRTPFWCCFKLYVWFHSHQWIQSKVIVRKRSIRVKISDFFVPFVLEIWRMTFKKK